jgi:hypothetical protein
LFHAGVDSSLLFDTCPLAGFKGELKSVFSFKISDLKGASKRSAFNYLNRVIEYLN